jgi:DNA mismatch endonuclease, patch repair protein
MDVHTPEIRSYNMSRIRNKNTKPELIVRKYLFNKGFRYRLNVNSLPGKPDIVLSKRKTVIFIHGCFWHGHLGCKKFIIPKTRTEWWQNKINRNRFRDLKNEIILKNNGWRVISIYECELNKNSLENTLRKILEILIIYGTSH